MGGLQRLFLKITPIIMLICFVCLGITHAFQQEGQPNITYLTSEEITLDDNETETTADDITIKNYSFDFQSYRNNININILKRSTNNIIDFNTYQDNLDRFNLIWEDGYNFGDGVQTITNAILLVINTLIIPINIVLMPLRLISGILLTAMSVIGINITRNTAIITALNGILDYATIPLISVTRNKDIVSAGTIYNMKNNIDIVFEEGWSQTAPVGYYWYPYNFYIDFGSDAGGRYKQLFTGRETINNVQHDKIWYVDNDGNQVLVYDNGWLYQDSIKITIISTPNQDNYNLRQIKQYFENNATIT